MKPRLDTPRVTPLDPADWTEDQARILGPVHAAGQCYNNLGTMARHGVAFAKLMASSGHIKNSSTLSARHRELAILRTGIICKSQYVWLQHRVVAQREGVPLADIDRVAHGPDAPGWSPEERCLLAAVDEMLVDHFISDAVWAELERFFTVQQIIDINVASGRYAMTASLLNSLGAQLDSTFRDDDPKTNITGMVYPD